MTRSQAKGAVFLALAGAVACSSSPGGNLTSFEVPPFNKDFGQVAETLDAHCGSLDCHGKTGRNLKLYGLWGLRADPSDIPGCRATTTAEQEDDYWSLVSLEPELTAAVFADSADGGAVDPERLTVVRKARGVEKHTGGTVFAKGTPGDLCVTSFFSHHLDGVSCRSSLPKSNGVLLVPRCSEPAGSPR